MENRMYFFEQNKKLEVIFEGEIDHLSTLKYRVELIERLNSNEYTLVIMNFKNVTFIDSSGIGMILGRYNQLNKRKIPLYFSQLSETTYRLFELSGLLKIIEIMEGNANG